MTPKEFSFYAEIFTEKLERDNKEKLEFAWLSACWQRVDKLEPLESYLKKAESEQPKTMSAEEMMLKVIELNAKMGGITVTPGGEE